MFGRTNKSWYIFLAALPFLTFICGYMFTLVLVDSSKVKIPNIIGKSVYNALQKTSEAGLTIKLLENVVSNDIPSGTILSQIPHAGNTAKKNSTIFLRVSQKYALKNIPMLIGSSKDKIAENFDTSEIPFNFVTLNHPTPSDHCFAQYPSSGNKKFNGIGTAYISTGIDRRIILPSFIGKTLQETQTVLNQYEIKVEFDKSINLKNATITHQQPIAGSIVNLSKPVVVHVKI